MKRNLICTFLITSLSILQIVQAQTSYQPTAAQIVPRILEALDVHDPVQYKAEMLFKYFEADTFEVRNFTIHFRSNPDNLLYGYDWEIGEKLKDGHTGTWMALAESLYVMYDGLHDSARFIVQRSLGETIELGAYQETIRDYFIFPVMVEPYTHFKDVEVTVVDSNNSYYLRLPMRDFSNHELFVSKETYMPIQRTSVMHSENYDFTQVMQINFTYEENCRQLPDTAFSPQHFVDLGYKQVVPAPDISSNYKEEPKLSPESLEMLLRYPFISTAGDTTLILELQEGYILLDFWFVSCVPCLSAMPDINQLAITYADKGLQVMGINCFDKLARKNVSKKLQEKNISIPLLYGEKDLVQALGVTAFPTYILITPEREMEFIRGGVDGVKERLREVFGE